MKVLRASKENLKVFEEKKSIIEAEEKKRKIKSEEIAKKIKDLEVIIIRNAAENGQLYGSVTSKDIVKEILLLNKIELLNEQINLKKTLKSIGVYEVEISVYTDLKIKILVVVAKTKELGLKQIKEFKSPKKIKKIQKKEDVDNKKNETKEKTELNTKEKRTSDCLVIDFIFWILGFCLTDNLTYFVIKVYCFSDSFTAL